ECLQAAWTLQHLDHDTGALVGNLEAVAAQTGHVQEDVGHAVVGNDKAVTLRDVEPLDDAGELDDARRLIGDIRLGLTAGPQPAARHLRSHLVRRHDAPTPPRIPGASSERFNSNLSRRED